MKGGKLVCKDVAQWPGPGQKRCIDLAIYKNGTESFWNDPVVEPGASCAEERRPHVARHHSGFILLGGEVKLNDRANAFGVSATDPLLRTGQEAELTRGQLAGYAADAMIHQQRGFIIMFYIYRTIARLLLFDRNGVVVSELIDLVKDGITFAEFFYRMELATDAQLGLDPTATMLAKDPSKNPDYQSLQQALGSLSPASDSRLTTYIKNAFKDDKCGWPFYNIKVIDRKSEKTHSFLIRNLSMHSSSMTGRATKGYIAFSIATEKFCFMKDCWRADSPLIRPELDIYDDLKEYGVRHVATVCCGGDVRVTDSESEQRTRTQDFLGVDKLLPRVHTRIVLNEIGIPLKDYIDSKELCTVVAFAYRGTSIVC